MTASGVSRQLTADKNGTRQDELRRTVATMLSLKKKEVPFHVGQKVCDGVGAVYEESDNSDEFEIHGRFATYRGPNNYGKICLKKRTKIGEVSKTVLKFKNVDQESRSKITIEKYNPSESSRLGDEYIDIDADAVMLNIISNNPGFAQSVYHSIRSGKADGAHGWIMVGGRAGNGDLKVCIELHDYGSTVEVAHQTVHSAV